MTKKSFEQLLFQNGVTRFGYSGKTRTMFFYTADNEIADKIHTVWSNSKRTFSIHCNPKTPEM